MITKNTTTLVEITGDVEASCWNDYKHSDCLEMTFKMTGDDDNEVKYNIYINYDRALRLLLEMKKRLTEKHKETKEDAAVDAMEAELFRDQVEASS